MTLLPAYSRIKITTREDAECIVKAFVCGRISALDRVHEYNGEELDARSLLAVSGNILIYKGARYRDGLTWTRTSETGLFFQKYYRVSERQRLNKYSLRFNYGCDTATLVWYALDDDDFPNASEVPFFQTNAMADGTLPTIELISPSRRPVENQDEFPSRSSTPIRHVAQTVSDGNVVSNIQGNDAPHADGKGVRFLSVQSLLNPCRCRSILDCRCRGARIAEPGSTGKNSKGDVQ